MRGRKLAWALLAAALAAGIGVAAWPLRPTPPRPDRTPVTTISDASPESPDTALHQHTNHLVDETSPYLLQHAHNPVNWYPWGEAAFEKARKEDKPIFLSVGYSTCYWCHVMEKESFEDEEVAAILNEHYVAIKVDREERPDIDEQYMLATQIVTRRGGWPNSVWLTPDGRPWMAGTYFPKPQFMEILEHLARAWDQRRPEINQQADQLAAAIARASAGRVAGEEANASLGEALINEAAGELLGRYDATHAGFGSAPKFPPHGTLRLLIERYRQEEDPARLEPITATLDAMWLGGMHDHVGGGFHRYATDNQWLLPHFEKMLYDNAQLLRLYVDGYRLTGRPRYRRAVADIFDWVRREMSSDEGAFYSAIDSGEVGKEGEAYVWHIDEVREVLGAEDAERFIEIYNIEKHGNFTEEATGERPGTNIPHLGKPLAAWAESLGTPAEPFIERMAEMRAKLLARRQRWPQPHKDDKMLAGWNGLMIDALAYAGRALETPRYTRAAAGAADFILQRMRREDGTLLRSYRAGEAKQPGYLDDHAYLGRGLLELYRATGESRWLEAAEQLAGRILEDFHDEEAGGFYFTGDHHETLLGRSKGLTGGGNVPNANGVAAEFFLELTRLTGNPAYERVARLALEALAPQMAVQPFSSESLLIAASRLLQRDQAAGASAEPAPEEASGTGSGQEAAAPETTREAGDPAAPTSGEAALTRRLDPLTLEVHVADPEVAPGETFEVTVAIAIDEGWHLYGRNPEIDFLVATDVSMAGDPAIEVGEVARPEPHRMIDPILEKELNTYTGRIAFRVPVTLKRDLDRDAIALELTVKTQACEDDRCLPPETTTLRLPLAVVRSPDG